MIELSAPFAPDWVSPPGESILDMAEDRGWSQTELAQQLGYTEKHMSQLINGKVPLSVDAAHRLERVVGGSSEFWLSREANYQNHKTRIEAAQKHQSWVTWLDELPVKDLMEHGVIPKQKLLEKNKPILVESCLRFFGVASPDDWRNCYEGKQFSFRKSKVEQSNVGAISAWLRLGEQQAECTECPTYNKISFEKALREIRNFTGQQPSEFVPKIRSLLLDAGVMFILVPAIPRAHVSGVARWLGSTKALIQLSLYGKTNDKFWFTFFHEAAHILLHSGTKEEKKSIFLDDQNVSLSDSLEESEANSWARDWLIPLNSAHELFNLKSKVDVEIFATKVNVHPGIVVGRLQHEGFIQPSWMNDLKEKFDFTEQLTPCCSKIKPRKN